MNYKINSIIISSILAFALIAAIIPATFAQNNTEVTPEGGNMTQGQSGNMTGMTQGQTSDDSDDGDDNDKDDGDNEDDKDEGE